MNLDYCQAIDGQLQSQLSIAQAELLGLWQ